VIRTVIAERIALIRAGLVACISQERDIEVVAALDRREPVLATVSSLRPDVAVIDDDIAGHDGFAVIQALHATTPSCHTLIMANRPHPRDLRKAVAAHATGFVLRDNSPEIINEAIRQVAKGMKAVDPDLAFATLDIPQNPMTVRECDVLRLAAAGASTAEIARQLCLTPGTVRNHISSIIAKIGARKSRGRHSHSRPVRLAMTGCAGGEPAP
jgi:two-component system, NarL family, response regulator DesR